MKKIAVLILIFAGCSHAPFDSQPMPTVDAARYMGKWYEIARMPSRFERGCDGVTAEYELRKDGSVDVLNTCRKDGPKGPARTAKARAWSTHESNSRYDVRFFWPFKAPYWIIDLDEDYRWAAVGHPERKYLWILSREPSLPPETEAGILARLAALGYDTARLERPRH